MHADANLTPVRKPAADPKAPPGAARRLGLPGKPLPLACLGLAVVSLVALVGAWAWLAVSDSGGTFRAAIIPADVDGDGRLDLLLQNVRQEAEWSAFAVTTLWMNQGDGRFVPTRLDALQLASGWAAAAGDLNGNGRVDLLLFQGYQLQLLTNQAGGGNGQVPAFQAAAIPAPQPQGQFGALRLGDLNGDGRLDAVVAGCCGRLFSTDARGTELTYSWLWLTVPPEAEQPAAVRLPALDGLALADVALGDLDGDGDLDLWAAAITPTDARGAPPADRVLLNDGAGRFVDSGQRLGTSDSRAVALGDVDGDGDLDALVGNGRGAQIWLNQGGRQAGAAGTFAPAPDTFPGRGARAVFLADLDADGRLDAVLGLPGQAVVWLRSADGGWLRSDQRFPISPRYGLAVADVNADGRPDIAAAAYDDAIRVWLNQGGGRFQASR